VSNDLASLYTDRFYSQANAAGASPSAKVCVPIVIDLLSPSRVIDVGCGRGEWLSEFLASESVTVLGVDGPHVDRSQLLIPPDRFQQHDLRTSLDLHDRADVALCLEVAEHLPSECAPGLVRSLTRLAPAVVFSAAVPGQGGVHHVNEQWPWYWQELFEREGFTCLDAFRSRIWHDDRVAHYYQQNLMLFVNPDVHPNLVHQYYQPDRRRQLTLVQSYILDELSSRPPRRNSILGRIPQKLRQLFA
jgi:SAM-dependent methyltransferase